MLGDDIMEGTKTTVRTVVHAARNALKGALMFAAIALVATPVIGMAVSLVGGAALATAAADVFTGAGLASIGWTAAASGIIGGAVIGVTSLIPGNENSFWSKLFARKPRAPKNMGQDVFPSQNYPASANTSRSELASLAASCPPPHTTVVDNSRTEVYSGNETPRTALISTQQTNTDAPALPAPDGTSSDPSYFRPGKGVELMQKGNARSSDAVLAKS